jgi:ubiquinone/menaquinone biosynthesis C-methylase UbiE
VEDVRLLVDLHITGNRQGPGSDAHTRRAIELAGLARVKGLRMADIGCGTGASTLVLAKELDAHIVAVDLLPEFLDCLEKRARAAGVSDQVSVLNASMDGLGFAAGSLDAIWSEGAVYNIGFEGGVRQWRRFLKPGGVLAVSELTWLTNHRPAELESHWKSQYPEVGTASSKLEVLERNGYSPLGYFALSEECWLDEYYRPMQQRFQEFLRRNGFSGQAKSTVAAEEAEIGLYERYRSFFSYGYYIARRTESD